MKEYLLPLKNKDYDGINFYRNGEGELEISAFNYKTPAEKVGGNDMGDFYDIIIFPEEPPKMPERFKAILTSPLHYISRMIDDGFLGVVAKVTTNSDNFMSDIYDSMADRAALYIKYYEELQDDEQT
jgi:hypothetical protein